MSADVIDLNALVPVDRRVTFAGREFTVPGDMPLVMYLQMNELDREDDAQALSGMVDLFVDLFHQKYQGDMAQDESKAWLRTELLKVGGEMIMAILATIYPNTQAEAPAEPGEPVDADAVDPPQTPEDGELTTTADTPAGATSTTTSPPTEPIAS